MDNNLCRNRSITWRQLMIVTIIVIGLIGSIIAQESPLNDKDLELGASGGSNSKQQLNIGSHHSDAIRSKSEINSDHSITTISPLASSNVDDESSPTAIDLTDHSVSIVDGKDDVGVVPTDSEQASSDYPNASSSPTDYDDDDEEHDATEIAGELSKQQHPSVESTNSSFSIDHSTAESDEHKTDTNRTTIVGNVRPTLAESDVDKNHEITVVDEPTNTTIDETLPVNATDSNVDQHGDEIETTITTKSINDITISTEPSTSIITTTTTALAFSENITEPTTIAFHPVTVDEEESASDYNTSSSSEHPSDEVASTEHIFVGDSSALNPDRIQPSPTIERTRIGGEEAAITESPVVEEEVDRPSHAPPPESTTSIDAPSVHIEHEEHMPSPSLSTDNIGVPEFAHRELQPSSISTDEPPVVHPVGDGNTTVLLLPSVIHVIPPESTETPVPDASPSSFDVDKEPGNIQVHAEFTPISTDDGNDAISTLLPGIPTDSIAPSHRLRVETTTGTFNASQIPDEFQLPHHTVAVVPEPEPTGSSPEPEPTGSQPEPEPTALSPEPEPTVLSPEPEPTIEHHHEAGVTPTSDLDGPWHDQRTTAEPEPEPEPTAPPGSSSQPEPEPELNPPPSAHPDGNDIVDGTLETIATAYTTTFKFRLPNIEYTNDFANNNSGPYRKLHDQVEPELERIFAQLIGESDYRLARIVRFSAGSVIVEGELQTANRIDDPEMLATKFEEQLAVEHRQLGANDVDLKSITVGGFSSKNYLQTLSSHESYTNSGTPGYVVGTGIALGVLAILLIAFGVIALNQKRAHRTLRLKEDDYAVAEAGRAVGSNPPGWQSAGGGANGRDSYAGVNLYEMRSVVDGGNAAGHRNPAYQSDNARNQHPMVTSLTVNNDEKR